MLLAFVNVVVLFYVTLWFSCFLLVSLVFVSKYTELVVAMLICEVEFSVSLLMFEQLVE